MSERADLRPVLRVITTIAAGVLLAAIAHSRARAGEPQAWIFWLAIVLITGPALFLLGSRAESRGGRISVLVAVGLGLYAVKVLRDPFAYTYADELAHLRNLQEILRTEALFGSNTILPVTASYPGLESVAAGFSSLAGLTPFAAGLATVAVARTLLMLATFLLYERLTGSPRLAAVGAVLSTAAPTYLYFSAQFSYESLAVPLAVAVVYSIIRRQSSTQVLRSSGDVSPDPAVRQSADRAEQRRWSAIIILLGAGVVATHHLTAYALIVFLIAVCGVVSFSHGWREAPWLALGALSALTFGMLSIASQTAEYLTPVLRSAVDSIGDTLSREAGPRKLFSGSGDVAATPFGERLIAVAAILLLTAAIFAGIRATYRERRTSPITIVLALAALGYLATQPLRLIPQAWESGNRAASVLFIGVGIIAGAGLVWWLDRRPPSAVRRALFAATGCVIIAGGIVAGWPSGLRLAAPYRATTAGTTVEPPGVELARWSATMFPAPVKFGAQDADARLLVTIGGQPAIQGFNPNVREVLEATRLEQWHRDLLREERIVLLATDRRTLSADNIAGYAFQQGAQRRLPAASATKFDLAGADRIYDGGDIVVFDVRSLW